MNPLSFAAVTILSGGLSTFAADIFRDDFESGADRWNPPSGQWKVVDGAGLDGSRALVLEYAKGEIPKWLERNEMVPVEPGEAYRFEAWVNEKEFKAKDRPVSVFLQPPPTMPQMSESRRFSSRSFPLQVKMPLAPRWAGMVVLGASLGSQL